MTETAPTTPILDALKGKLELNSTITVKGWIRSKRDSKAGISFLAINDGSSFDSIQAVVPSELDNYESEVLKITTGAGVEVTGTLVESQGKFQDHRPSPPRLPQWPEFRRS
ncbi:MAG: OB-fold nucleic acid binding domain-containing protein, partial [Pseudomonadales bacterium]